MDTFNTMAKNLNDITPNWAGNIRNGALLCSSLCGSLSLSTIPIGATAMMIIQIGTVIFPVIAGWAQSIVVKR